MRSALSSFTYVLLNYLEIEHEVGMTRIGMNGTHWPNREEGNVEVGRTMTGSISALPLRVVSLHAVLFNYHASVAMSTGILLGD